MPRSKHEIIADAIAVLVRRNADLTDDAIAKIAGYPMPKVADVLNTELHQVWMKLPGGWKIARAENAVIVRRV